MVTALVLLACACSMPPAAAAQTPQSQPYWLLQGNGVTKFGPFSGYLWENGIVRSVSAWWTVSRIRATSRAGYAGTWIGAQAPGATNTAPFIQVGTNAFRLTHLLGRPHGANVYEAFFSDTALHFHPLALFPVRAGDTLFARLRLGGGRWHVLIFDITHPHRTAFATKAETGAVFNAAEWLQEDPSELTPGHVLPYPLLTAVSFHHIRVNACEPKYANVRSQWMSENKTDLAPGPLRGDAFYLHPTQPTEIGLHYLQIMVEVDVALHGFETGLAHWSSASAGKRTTERAAIVSALEANVQELAGGQWPRDVRRLLARLVGAARRELAVTEREPTRGARLSTDWLITWGADERRVSAISSQIRRLLHLPQLFPIPGQPD